MQHLSFTYAKNRSFFILSLVNVFLRIGFYQKIVRCDVGYDQMSQAGHCLKARDKQSHGLATQPNIPHIEI